MILTRKFGYNADVDAAVDLWSADIDYPFPTAARRLGVSSDSAQDDPGGSGASAVKIYGLDENYNPISEEVFLSGGSTTETTQSFLRVNHVRVSRALPAGGYVNAGIISVKHGLVAVGDDAPPTIAHIPAGHGSSPAAIYTVPASFAASFVRRWFASCPGAVAGDTLLALQVRPYNATATAWQTVALETVDNLASPGFDRQLGVPVGAKADIRMRVLSTDSANLLVSGGFDVLLDGGSSKEGTDLI